MEIKTIEVPKEEAEKEYKKYAELVKKRHERELILLKQCNYHLKNGRKIVDIFDAIKRGGVDKNGEPRLAIARADWGNVVFSKHRFGTGLFGSESSEFVRFGLRDSVQLPVKFYEKEWPNQYEKDPEKLRWGEFRPVRQAVRAGVPIIPASLRPDGELMNYYILFEVKKWEDFVIGNGKPGKDPFLLKRLSENMFVILATWEMTELEEAILG